MGDPINLQFSMVPIEAISDPLLTPAEFRVLVALYSFRDRNLDTCWPSLQSLADRAGYSKSNEVSKITTRLEKKGWLDKSKKRGFNGPKIYKLTIPERLSLKDQIPQVGQTAQVGENAKLQVGQTALSQVGQTAQPNIPVNIHSYQTSVASTVPTLEEIEFPEIPPMEFLNEADQFFTSQGRGDLTGEEAWDEFKLYALEKGEIIRDLKRAWQGYCQARVRIVKQARG